MKETSITQGILGAIHDAGGIAFKVHGGGMQGKGHPDVVGCYVGRMLALEVKRPGEQPTRIQVWNQGQWREAGAYAHVVDCKADVVSILAQIDQDMDDEAAGW